MNLWKERRLPRWLGAAVHLIAAPALFGVVPWALSLLAVRHGWVAGQPGVFNLVGLMPVALGVSLYCWSMIPHFTSAPDGWKLHRTTHYPTPDYLLTQGPYRYTRNPIYLAEGCIWLGWIVFYGSVVMLLLFVAVSLLAGPVVMRREERGLEARFGESYRQYKRNTPRFLFAARH